MYNGGVKEFNRKEREERSMSLKFSFWDYRSGRGFGRCRIPLAGVRCLGLRHGQAHTDLRGV